MTLLRLSKTRRKRPVPEDWATAEDVGSFYPATESASLFPGAVSIAVDPSGDAVLSGGKSGTGTYSISRNRLVEQSETDDPVTDAIWAGSRSVIGTAKGIVTVLEQGQVRVKYSAHIGVVTALALHPSGDILASVGTDKSYVFYDLSTDVKALQITTDSCELASLGWRCCDLMMSSSLDECAISS